MNDVKAILQQLADGSDLKPVQASRMLEEIIAGKTHPAVIAAFLFGMRAKGETIEELTAFARVMRSAAVKVEVNTEHAVDLCGTGGDGSGTFNISTAAMFVAAGAGVPVLKHGNSGVSSQSGSYDVLCSLGAKPGLEKKQVENCFHQTGMAFMYAPLFHPAMSQVMPVRKVLGIRTFFNMLGPLLNPADVKRQVIGAFSTDAAGQLIRILENLNSEFAYTCHADDGLDEFSTAAPTTVYELRDGTIRKPAPVDGRLFGLEPAKKEELQGGTAEDNADIIRALFNDAGTTPQRDIVLLNATFAIHCSGLCDDLHDAFHLAEESLESGDAREALHRFVTCTNDLHIGA